MKYPCLIRAAALAAAMGAGIALAQTSPAVVSDAAPPPPEDRASIGAVVLDTSPIRAQQAALPSATQTMGAGPSTGVLTIDAKASAKAKAKAEKKARKAELERQRLLK
jgi:hypothetical protein